MNNRIGLAIAGVIAVIAVIFAIVQSGNLSQSTTQLAALQTTATVQASSYANQGTAAVATLSAASTTAADTQQQALSDAANTAATAQAKALADAAQAASTLQAQVLAAAQNAAATEEVNARKEVANAAATAQASAVSAAQNAAATEKAHVIATGQAQATATLGAVVKAAASAQASAISAEQNAAATEKAHVIATVQAQATATLEAVVNAAATAQASAVNAAQNAAATEKAHSIGTVEAQATATLGAVIAQAATDSAQLQAEYQSTTVAVETQIADVQTALATAQFKPTATATAAPTETASVDTPTLAATTSASAGVATTVATDQAVAVPEGWKRFIGKGVAIQLPNTFVGSELGSDPKAFANMLRGLGPDFAAAASLFESNPEILAFIAINKGSSATDLPANVIIVSIPLPSAIPMNTMLDATIQQLPSGSKVVERSIVQVGDYEAGRMILETHVGTIISTQLQYYIIANNALYLVGFTGKPDTFDSQVPLFEKSMKTFEILAKPGI